MKVTLTLLLAGADSDTWSVALMPWALLEWVALIVSDDVLLLRVGGALPQDPDGCSSADSAVRW
jgi:hypothetical protein